MMMMMMGGSCRSPFTASQWQELELQALIFKYMVSGIPVPHDLILCIRRSLFMDPQAFAFLPHPPAIGWGMYQLGDGRKAADPEPGRCRRTDGKKWRCSKEAFPDSKYCERHMHRGKSRSRKPVELSLATNPTSSRFSSSPNFPPLSLSTAHPRHGVFPCPASARPATSGCSQQDDNYWNIRAFKGDANEYPFFSEACRARRGTVNAEEEEEEKHCFVLGADFKTERAAKLEREGQALNSVRPFHCFLDEKPPKVEGSWMSMNVDQSKQASSLKTQLSISISASQCYNDG